MGKKTPGRLAPPPSQAEFDRLPLRNFCRTAQWIGYRMHPLNREEGKGQPWPAVFFSIRGSTRFDPTTGPGTMCLAKTLPGALMEIFDDRWGAAGTPSRSLTRLELEEWWVTLISTPAMTLFDAAGGGLSKIGTDAQLVTGDYSVTREWALRIANHPDTIDGVLYPSRHDPARKNIAVFRRTKFMVAQLDRSLTPAGLKSWRRGRRYGNRLVHGPATLLREHPELRSALVELEVPLIP